MTHFDVVALQCFLLTESAISQLPRAWILPRRGRCSDAAIYSTRRADTVKHSYRKERESSCRFKMTQTMQTYQAHECIQRKPYKAMPVVTTSRASGVNCIHISGFCSLHGHCEASLSNLQPIKY
ncbi:hypothetical protein MHYP_G00266850 [Metynnis hypsauchen]